MQELIIHLRIYTIYVAFITLWIDKKIITNLFIQLVIFFLIIEFFIQLICTSRSVILARLTRLAQTTFGFGGRLGPT